MFDHSAAPRPFPDEQLSNTCEIHSVSCRNLWSTRNVQAQGNHVGGKDAGRAVGLGEEPGGFPLAEHVQQEEGGRRRSGLVLKRPEGWGCGPHGQGRFVCEWLDVGEWVSAGVLEDGQRHDG